MSEDDPNAPASEAGDVEEEDLLETLLQSTRTLSQMYLEEAEKGKRTVVGLIYEAESRLMDLASLTNPDAPPSTGPMLTTADRLRDMASRRQLSEEGHQEAMDIVRVLMDALTLLGAYEYSNMRERFKKDRSSDAE